MFARLAMDDSSIYAAWVLSGVLQHLHRDFKQYVTQRQESVQYLVVSTHERPKEIHRWNLTRICHMHYTVLP